MDCLNIADVVVVEGDICFFENNRQALCRVDLEEKEIEIECAWQLETPIVVCKIASCKKKLFLISINGFRVLIYDLISKEYRDVHSKLEQERTAEDRRVNFCVAYEKKLFIFLIKMICHEGDFETVIFDLEKETFDVASFVPFAEKLGNNTYTFHYPTEKENIVYNALADTDQYIQFNLETKTYEHFCLQDKEIHLSAICCDEHGIWITLDDQEDFFHVPYGEKKSDVQDLMDNESCTKKPYSYIKYLSNHFIALPRYGDKAILIDRMSGKKHDLLLCGEDRNKLMDGLSKCVTCLEYDGKIYLFPFSMRHVMEVDLKTMNIRPIHFYVKRSEQFRMYYNSTQYYTENLIYGVSDFLQLLHKEKNEEGKKLYKNKGIGKSIYWEM